MEINPVENLYDKDEVGCEKMAVAEGREEERRFFVDFSTLRRATSVKHSCPNGKVFFEVFLSNFVLFYFRLVLPAFCDDLLSPQIWSDYLPSVLRPPPSCHGVSRHHNHNIEGAANGELMECFSIFQSISSTFPTRFSPPPRALPLSQLRGS